MAVKLRLTRMGAKKKPFYRIVAVDSRQPRDGKYIELIGTYNPVSQPKQIKIDHDKAKEWLARGAQPSDRVRFLFENEGILEHKPRPVVKKKEEKQPESEIGKQADKAKEETKSEELKESSSADASDAKEAVAEEAEPKKEEVKAKKEEK